MARDQVLRQAYAEGFAGALEKRAGLFSRKPAVEEDAQYLDLIAKSDLPDAVRQRLLSDPATIEAVRQMYLPFGDLPYVSEGEYQSDTDQANAPWHFIHDYFGPSRDWDAYVKEHDDTVPGLPPGAPVDKLYADTDVEDAEEFVRKILAAEQNNVHGHLKQAYAEGFGAGLRKRAMPRGLGDVPVAAGPAQMAAALQLLGQARALGTPTHGELEDKGVTEKGYSSSLRRMKGKKKLSDARTDKVLNMVLGGLLGGVAGAATKDPLNAVVGAGIGTGAGALRAHVLNKNVLATLKVLKDRGVLTPELLEKAYPVLMSPKP